MPTNWDLYENRLTIKGTTQRDRNISQLKSNITNKIINSPSYQSVTINSIVKSIIVKDTDKEHIKEINSLPEQIYNLGDLIVWKSSNWLVTDCSVDNTILISGKITQCNYTLKVQDTSGTVISIPCIFESNSGSLQYDNMLTTVQGNAQIKCRFGGSIAEILVSGTRLMIDSRLPSISKPNCYIISNSVFKSYDGANGYLEISLEKDEFNVSTDNKTIGICDYKVIVPSTGTAKITFTTDAVIKVGGSNKIFTAVFTNSSGVVLDLVPVWSMVSSTGSISNFTTIIDNITKTIKIKCADISSMIGSTLTLTLSESTSTYSATLLINIVPI